MKHKSDGPGSEDEALHELLGEWRTDAALPQGFQAGFQAAVWRRIEWAECAPAPAASPVWFAVAHRIGAALARPAFATAYVAVLLAMGVTAGWTQARQEIAQTRDSLQERYVRALDPYRLPRE
jgi:hypothetical protein